MVRTKMQVVDLPENTTKDKILEFSNLKKGWHFGKGVPPTKKILQLAVDLAGRVALSGFRSNAFPGVDGEIMVTVYHGEDYLEFTFETNGTVTFVWEKGEAEIAYEEELTVDQAKRRLDAFGEKIWKSLSGSFTPNIMTQPKKSSRVLLSKTPRDQEFQLYLSHASMKAETGRAPIFASIMSESLQIQSSSGQSGKEFYLTDAF